MLCLVRWVTGAAGVARMGYTIFTEEFSILWFLLGLLLLVFGTLGYRKMLSSLGERRARC